MLKKENGRPKFEMTNHSHDMKKHYRQVSMGYGSRTDFTKTPQQDYDPGFVYDQEKSLSI